MSCVTPTIGEHLGTNLDRPILKLVDDTLLLSISGFWNALLYRPQGLKSYNIIAPDTSSADRIQMSCFPGMHEKQGVKNHGSCATNIAEVMKEHGMNPCLEVTDPFNLFQNTPNVRLEPILGSLGSSKPGDYVDFLTMEDAICAAPCRPYDPHGFNGGKITDVALVTRHLGSLPWFRSLADELSTMVPATGIFYHHICTSLLPMRAYEVQQGYAQLSIHSMSCPSNYQSQLANKAANSHPGPPLAASITMKERDSKIPFALFTNCRHQLTHIPRRQTG
ncbi:uncharacterized protein MYCFIDRAFT_169573 [Pseudocercospora fijiensis CIRAD86]|uniref:DUF1989 domain-containing protein n=1 Tax=Pseudocercospora fijiensis (strain CIRAD86) TaxID=383855 RepID=N1QA92_PSEFD|nr:uncharacterized protein MYCFIDRAFT_169573 [Pseudocercospora fijiensis CIRAD86]EME87828.1 hypothetical protein MYCFIDRAFT_169573 [Pseudocercospora fijiensis CIRAD86]